MALVLDLFHDKNYQPRPFRFISAWLRHPNCKDIISEAWKIGINGFDAFQLVNK